MKFFLVSLLLILPVHIAVAQTKSYTIQSFEGTMQKIQISEADRGRTIVIKCLNNKLAIFDCYGLIEAHVLYSKFLEIIYNERGGSGFDPTGVLILCMSNGKLVTAMNTMYACTTVDVGAELNFKAIPSIKGNDSKNYTLSVHIHKKVDGKNEKWGGPYDKRETTVLKFDPVNHIFYSGYKTLNQVFKYFDKRKPKRIKGTFPFIDIDKNELYFINGLWNEKSHFTGDDKYLNGDFLNSSVTRLK